MLGKANGNLDAPLVFVAEAPGRAGADRTGIPMHGDRTGLNFAHLLDVLGWQRKDIFVTNAVLCNPRTPDGRNRPPRAGELQNCLTFLERTIDLVSPRYIASLGRVALGALGRIEPHNFILKRDVGKQLAWRGRWLVPFYHPSPRVMASHRDRETQEADYRQLAAYLSADGIEPPGE